MAKRKRKLTAAEKAKKKRSFATDVKAIYQRGIQLYIERGNRYLDKAAEDEY
jgi:hypothetical protein